MYLNFVIFIIEKVNSSLVSNFEKIVTKWIILLKIYIEIFGIFLEGVPCPHYFLSLLTAKI